MFSKTDHYDFNSIFNNPQEMLPSIPGEYPESSRFRFHGMYTVIDNEWVIPLAEWIKGIIRIGRWEVKEVMAGRGWLARALSQEELYIEASDDGSDYNHRKIILEYEEEILNAVYDVAKEDAISVAQRIKMDKMKDEKKRSIVIVAYPSEMDKAAFEFVRLLPKDTLVIYIGDDLFQNTADENFRDAISWIHEDDTHPDKEKLKGFPLDADIEGVGNDETKEDTVKVVIRLGTPK
ncbi:hypothetical protein [Bacillus sp. S10(2024)]|uniref:hypothetical protein n=1 Tax=Bacillus sp. S10(2024) TaxID=3162886 RepID=UPI003D1CA9F4